MSEVIDRPETTFVRWTATVFYKSDTGMVDVTHDLEEISDLHEIVERGPHWDTIYSIVITRAGFVEQLTIETAAEL